MQDANDSGSRSGRLPEMARAAHGGRLPPPDGVMLLQGSAPSLPAAQVREMLSGARQMASPLPRMMHRTVNRPAQKMLLGVELFPPAGSHANDSSLGHHGPDTSFLFSFLCPVTDCREHPFFTSGAAPKCSGDRLQIHFRNNGGFPWDKPPGSHRTAPETITRPLPGRLSPHRRRGLPPILLAAGGDIFP